MAGIIGQIGFADSERFWRATNLLRHDERFASRQYRDDAHLKLASVFRRRAPAQDAYEAGRRVGAIVYGAPLSPSRSAIATPSEVLAAYLSGGERSLTEFDGGFVIAILDEPRGELIIVNDRTATHGLVYIAGPRQFAFAPEGKAVLLAMNREPRLDVAGALEFLSLGFCAAERTLFEGVSLMPPAHVLKIALDDASHTLHPYWDLAFRENRSLRSERAAVATLFEVLRANVERAAHAATEGYDLLLTGGYDSRAVLALSESIGRKPRRAISWGVSATIRGSDPYVAERLAAQYDVPFEFVAYDHDSFPDRAEQWAFVSEVGSDNLGNFAAGPRSLIDAVELTPAVFNGDQLFGFGGIPVGFADAFEVGTGLPYRGLAPGVAALLTPSRVAEAADLTRSSLLRMALERGGGPNKDVQDYLAWQTHGIRWLNAPMYHREPIVSPWRPLAHRSAIELFEQLPASFRVDKRLLVRMLELRLPRVLDEPIASANSLVDWNSAFTSQTATGSHFRALAEEARFLDSEVGAFFDAGAYRRAVTAYLSTPSTPIRRVPEADASIVRWRRGLARWRASSLAIRATQRVVRGLKGKVVGASTTRVIWRVALLNLLLSTAERGWFRVGGPWQTQAPPLAERPVAWGIPADDETHAQGVRPLESR